MGGLAIKNYKTLSVRRRFVEPTIDYVSKITNINREDFHLLGSAGKVDLSGDIDLAIDCNKYNIKDIVQVLQHFYGTDRCVYNPGTQVTSIAVPIGGEEINGVCQVDLMATPCVEWAKFAYYYAGPEQTQYKGAVRALLLMGVTSTFVEPGIDHFVYEQDKLIIRAGRTMDLNKGMRRVFQYRPKSVDGSRYLASMKTVSRDQFFELFPDINISKQLTVVKDPHQFTSMLFGDNILPDDLNVAERIIALIKYKFADDKVEQIFKNAAARAPRDKILLPGEILQYQ